MLSPELPSRNENEGARPLAIRPGGSGQMSAGEPFGVGVEQTMHLAHRFLGRSSVVRGAQVLEDGVLRLARLLLLDCLVHRVVLAAPLGTYPVVLDEGATDGAGDLDHFLLQQGRRAEGGAPRPLMRELLEERDDRRHLGKGKNAVVRVARVTEVVADPPEELVVVRGGPYPTVQVAEVFDQQVARAVLANLEVVTTGVDTAEDPGEPGDQQVVLGDVAPDLLAGERARGEALEVHRAAEGALRQQFRRQRIEPLRRRHGSDYSEASARASGRSGDALRRTAVTGGRLERVGEAKQCRLAPRAAEEREPDGRTLGAPRGSALGAPGGSALGGVAGRHDDARVASPGANGGPGAAGKDQGIEALALHRLIDARGPREPDVLGAAQAVGRRPESTRRLGGQEEHLPEAQHLPRAGLVEADELSQRPNR